MRIRYTLATTAVMLIFLILIFVTQKPASAATIDDECYSLHEQFLQSETYDQAGRSAVSMSQLGCWPELQNASQTSGYTSPTDCNSLGTLIVENSDWSKVYESKPVAYWNLEGGAEERQEWYINPNSSLYRRALDNRIPFWAVPERKLKMQIISSAEAPPGGTRTLECLAKVRTDQGHQTVYYYLDNDGGEEWWGYLYLRD